MILGHHSDLTFFFFVVDSSAPSLSCAFLAETNVDDNFGTSFIVKSLS